MEQDYEELSAELREKLVQERRYELEDLSAVLALPEGRRVLRRILAHGGMFRISFTGNSKTFFNEGARNLSLWLFQEILATQPSKELIGDLMLIAEQERSEDV